MREIRKILCGPILLFLKEGDEPFEACSKHVAHLT